MTGETVRMRQEFVRLDVESLCGPRLTPVADIELPDHVAVHRITTWPGDDVRCAPGEAQVWDDAARGCLDIVSRALESLYRAHGGTRVEVDLANGTRSWQHTEPPFLRGRAARRSADAQRAFVAEVEAATAAYRPVFEQISTLAAESRAALRAAQLRRAQVVQEAARRHCWVVRDDDGTVCVGWVDGTDGALTAAELDRTLIGLLPAGEAEPVWDPEARAALERSCRAAGVEIGFAQWWDTVTEGRWRRRRETHQHVRHGTAHHSSYGVGGHSTFGTSF